MRPGAVKVETNGSYWWFDESRQEYLRLPKTEGPRERPEWSDERAGVLQDGVWHPYESYTVTPRQLLIFREHERTSYAPRFYVVDPD